MSRHDEISTMLALESIAEYTLLALDVTDGLRYRRKRNFPISVAERQYSTEAIILLFVSFEGYINRVIYLLENKDNKLKELFREGSSYVRLKGILGKTKESAILLTQYNEALVLRNALMHGHLYETERTIKRKILKTHKRILQEDNSKYQKYVRQTTYRTKSSHLNVVPSEVGVDDLYKMLRLWNKIYIRINKLHGNIGYLPSAYPHRYATSLHAAKGSDKFHELEHEILSENGLLGLVQYIENQSTNKGTQLPSIYSSY